MLRMSRLGALSLFLALAAAASCGAHHRRSAAAPAPEPGPAELEQRVAAYVALRDRVAHTVSDGQTSDPVALRARQQKLAGAIRSARPHAAPGDIFTPAVVPYFRRIVKSDLKTRTPGETDAALEEVPQQVPFKIHDTYPDSAVRATVPPMLLARMPRLPEQLEYRFLGRHLILLDVGANLIVDYIPGLLATPA